MSAPLPPGHTRPASPQPAQRGHFERPGGYALQVLGPGHVVLSRRPEDVQDALQEAWRPVLEQLAEAYRLERRWWALSHRGRSRIVTRRKQRRTW